MVENTFIENRENNSRISRILKRYDESVQTRITVISKWKTTTGECLLKCLGHLKRLSDFNRCSYWITERGIESKLLKTDVIGTGWWLRIVSPKNILWASIGFIVHIQYTEISVDTRSGIIMKDTFTIGCCQNKITITCNGPCQ